MSNINRLLKQKRQEVEQKQQQLTEMVQHDLWDTMEELLHNEGYDFEILDTPNKYGRYYESNAPLDKLKTIHNQAIDQVIKHYRWQDQIPAAIRDMITKALNEKRIE